MRTIRFSGTTRPNSASQNPSSAVRYAVAVALAIVVSGIGAAPIQSAESVPALKAGAVTRGGLVDGVRIEHVTTLADDGPGSLRAVLSERGAKVVVFDVGGVIELKSDLRIGWPNVTIAGQTAPYPGILIKGAKIRIVAADVVLQHISVHPMFNPLGPGVRGEIDSLAVGECKRCAKQVSDVRIENVSAGWANDEVLGLWGDKLKRITIRNSIIAEGFRNAGHPKGQHSMGLLIGEGIQAVEVTGNLFANNNRRNPVLGGGASAYVANNLIYNPGASIMHMYDDGPDQVTRATLVANMIKLGPDSEPSIQTLDIPQEMVERATPARVFAKDNRCCGGTASERAGDKLVGVTAPPVLAETWTLMPVDAVEGWVRKHAGSRPKERNPIDARIVASVTDNTGRIIDGAADVGGHPDMKATKRLALVPDRPFDPVPRLSAGSRLEAWLCLQHFEVGGPLTAECPDDAAKIRAALKFTKASVAK